MWKGGFSASVFIICLQKAALLQFQHAFVCLPCVQVQLQLLTAIVKLFLKKPTETQELVQQVLSLATQVSAETQTDLNAAFLQTQPLSSKTPHPGHLSFNKFSHQPFIHEYCVCYFMDISLSLTH